MNGRSTVLVLFFWAFLTLITPTLVRMSASAKLLNVNGFQARGMQSRLFPRRALIDIRFVESEAPAPALAPGPGPGTGQAPAPAPALAPGPGPGTGQAPAPAPGVIWRSKFGVCSVCGCPELIRGPCYCCLQ